MTLYIQRHAPTEHNDPDPKKEKIRGWGKAKLSEDGKTIAKDSAESLRDKGIDLVLTSDLPRAKETAEIVAKELGGVPVVPTADLRTWNVGDLSGKAVSEAKPQLDMLQHTKPTKAAPGGESYAAFFKRWSRHVAQLQMVAKKRHVLVVVHGRQTYSLPNILADRGMHRVPTKGAPDPGDILEVQGTKVTTLHSSGSMAKAAS